MFPRTILYPFCNSRDSLPSSENAVRVRQNETGQERVTVPQAVESKPESAVVVEDLHKSFGPLEVLKGVSLNAHTGDVVSMIGASGSGKSTFLRCINFLELPTKGRIFVTGEEIRSTSASWSASAPASAWSSRVSICGST
jgi:ABC-type lipoprotein export system ATPase subunit